MANKILDKVEEIITPKIAENGFELEYVESLKENGKDILRVVIEKKGESITSDDCEKISRIVEEDIDKVMKEKEYVLEISSAGLEKNIKNIRLFKKYINEKVFVRLFKKTKFTDDFLEKEFEAIIKDVNEQNGDISFEIQNKQVIIINFKDIAIAHTVFDFDEFFKNN